MSIIMRPLPAPAIGIVAPMREELLGWLGSQNERLTDHHVSIVDGQRFDGGRFAGDWIVATATGDGSERAERGLRRLIAHYSPRAIVATGIGGALTPGLEPGTVVIPTVVRDASGDAPGASPPWSELDWTGVESGSVLSVERIVVSPEDKDRLRREVEDPSVVDLESATYVRVARQQGLPYLVARSVSDTAEEALPELLARCQRRDGSIDRARVVRGALVRPWLWSVLNRLRSRVQLCSERLGEVLEEVIRHAPRPPEAETGEGSGDGPEEESA